MKEIIKNLLPKSLKRGLHQAHMSWRGSRYKGNQHYCICCDGNYSEFLDMTEGSHAREKVVCPGCGSVERHRLILRFLQAKEKEFFPKGARVLYIAPMHGIRKYFKEMSQVKYLGADLDSSLADVHFDLEDIPYPDGSFDFCICSHTLAHVRNDKNALKELHRVLSPEGRMLVLDRIYDIPTTKDMNEDMSQKERLDVYKQVDRWRIYGQDFGKYLASFGFSVDELAFGETMDDVQLKKEVIDVGDVIYSCSKIL